MNTPVNFEISKVLKEKGFNNIECDGYYHVCDGYTKGYAHCYSDVNTQREDAILAPTIADVVMWLYEKHGIWTVVNVNIMGSWYFEHFDLKEKRNAQFKPTDTHYDSPTEAYEAAIIYTLKNLI